MQLFERVLSGISALALAGGVSALLVIGPAGCAGGGGGGPDGWPAVSGEAIRAEGLVRDLDPAVRRAAREHALAVMRIHEPEPGTRYYELHSIRGEDAWLEIEWSDTDASWADVIDASMQMQIGAVGHPDREEAFMRSVRTELAKIRKGD